MERFWTVVIRRGSLELFGGVGLTQYNPTDGKRLTLGKTSLCFLGKLKGSDQMWFSGREGAFCFGRSKRLHHEDT